MTSQTSGPGRPLREATTRRMAKSAYSGPRLPSRRRRRVQASAGSCYAMVRAFRAARCGARRSAAASARAACRPVSPPCNPSPGPPPRPGSRPTVALVANHPANRRPPARSAVPGASCGCSWPSRPQYCRATPTGCTPCLGMSVVSTSRMPRACPVPSPPPASAVPGTAGRTRGCPSQSTAGGAPGSCRRPAGTGPCARPTCAALRTATPQRRRRRRLPGRGAGTGAENGPGKLAARSGRQQVVAG